MSGVLQYAGIGLILTICIITIKQQKPEYALLLAIGGCMFMMIMLMPYFKASVDALRQLGEKTGTNSEYISLILKLIGIAYIVQFAAETAKDAGQGAVASKIEFSGKVIIFSMSVPLLISLVDSVLNLIP